MRRFNIIYLILLFTVCDLSAQDTILIPKTIIDYSYKNEYEIAEIKVTGVRYLDPKILAQLSGLRIGQKITIPGDVITDALKKYWKQGLFSDVKIFYTKIEGNQVYLEIFLRERPRLAEVTYKGIKKSDQDDLKEKLELRRGSQVTDNLINNTKNIIRNYFLNKGFLNTEVNIIQQEDSVFQNVVNLLVDVNKNKRVKIKEINFIGISAVKPGKLRHAMKETKRKRIYNLSKPSKYIEDKFKTDKDKIIEKYNELGYRDARIIKDSTYIIDDKLINLDIYVDEGKKYYYRNISWIGNTKHSTEFLNKVLNVKKGDIYNQKLLDKRLFSDDDAVSTIYLDDGYLFFNVSPVEVHIDNDSVDLEMRIFEGQQANINDVSIEGNEKTNEQVIRRELRTRPGQLFSKTDITRSIRELANLGHFDPEKLDVVPIPDPAKGTVDLKYKVEEKSTDQLELSGGYGGGMFLGTIGLRFNNFSARNMLRKDAWRPIPSGDGQTLSIRGQTSGRFYQSLDLSFVEPWFGGKKPNSFSMSFFWYFSGSPNTSSTSSNYYDPYSTYGVSDYYNPSYYNGKAAITRYMHSIGGSIGLGQRLEWPDDFFTLYNELSFEQYRLHYYNIFPLDNNNNNRYTDSIDGMGRYNILSFNTTFSRNSVDQPLYPRRGSSFTLKLQLTPPYSFFRSKDFYYPAIPDSVKHKWVEFNKWTFKTEWYLNIVDKLVLATKTNFGYLAYYNKIVGYSPFEGYDVGVDPMSYMYTFGREKVTVRGYKEGQLTPIVNGQKAGNLYVKYTAELRYPVSLSQQATVYVLTFAEAANAWADFSNFNPFDVKRTAGIGMRAFLPMFGLLGIDYGYRFDNAPNAPARKGEFHFVLGQEF